MLSSLRSPAAPSFLRLGPQRSSRQLTDRPSGGQNDTGGGPFPSIKVGHSGLTNTEGILTALSPRRRGRPASSPEQRELARLRQENERLSQRLVAAETVIEVQKKVALLLGLVEPSRPNDERS